MYINTIGSDTKINNQFHNLTDESFDEALLTRPIESYLDENSDIDALFGYTSAVNESDPIFIWLEMSAISKAMNNNMNRLFFLHRNQSF